MRKTTSVRKILASPRRCSRLPGRLGTGTGPG
jgi:hypothetical protein